MQTLGDPRAHFWRVIKMAKANEVDLSTALDEDRINIADWAEMVERCRGCAAVAACDKRLIGSPKLDAAPAYCRNKATFADLRST